MKLIDNIEAIKNYLEDSNYRGVMVYTYNGNDFFYKIQKSNVFVKGEYSINEIDELHKLFFNDETILWSRLYFAISNIYNGNQVYLVDLKDAEHDIIKSLLGDSIKYEFESPNGYHFITLTSIEDLLILLESYQFNIIDNERLYICLYNKDYSLYNPEDMKSGPIDLSEKAIITEKLYDDGYEIPIDDPE